MNQALRRHSLLLGPWFVMAAALGGLAIAAPARAQQLVYKSPSDPALPQAGFFLGLGGSYNSVNFGTQNVYAVGTSDVYQGGVLASTGSASGPANIYMGSELPLPLQCKRATSKNLPTATGFGEPSFHTVI